MPKANRRQGKRRGLAVWGEVWKEGVAIGTQIMEGGGGGGRQR